MEIYKYEGIVDELLKSGVDLKRFLAVVRDSNHIVSAKPTTYYPA